MIRIRTGLAAVLLGTLLKLRDEQEHGTLDPDVLLPGDFLVDSR